MPSFSTIFPTYAGLFSKIGNFIVPSKPKIGAAVQPGQVSKPGETTGETMSREPGEAGASRFESSTEASRRALIETGAVETSGPAVLNPVEIQILHLYQSWVELDKSVFQAHEDLQRILNSRGKATVLRGQAQETLAQGEELREEAQRIGEAAWRAFDRGFATNIRGFARRRAMVREIDQYRRTQAELQRNVHKKAWEQSETSREASTIQALKAFNALAMVADQVERELAEVANLPKLAETLKASALEELGCAEAVKDELLLLGREALNQLDLTPTSTHEYGSEGTSSQDLEVMPPENRGRTLGDGGPAFDPGPQSFNEAPSSLEQMPVQSSAGSDSLSWDVKEVAEVPTEIPRQDPTEGFHGASPEASPEAHKNPGSRAEPSSPIGFGFPLPDEDNPAIQASIDPAPMEDVASKTVEGMADDPSTAAIQPPTRPPSPAQNLIPEKDENWGFVQSFQPAGSAVPEIDIPERRRPEMNGPEVDSPEVDGPEVDQRRTSVEGGPAHFPAEGAISKPKPPEPPPSLGGRSSVADQLIREMEAARIAGQPRHEPPGSVASTGAQGLIRDMQAFRSPPVEVQPEVQPGMLTNPESTSQDAAPQFPAPQFPAAGASLPGFQPGASATGRPPQAAYFDRLYLMFPATLTQDEVGMVWAAVEDAAQGSRILDSRLLSAAEGIQFTVQLGAGGLLTEDLRSRLSGAEFEGMEPDRLNVDWPRG